MTDSQAAENPQETPAAAVAAPPAWLTRLARRPFALLALFGLLLWLPGVLSLPALDRDESRFAQSSRQMVESGDMVDIRFGHVPRYKKPIGIYWLQATATKLAGPFLHGSDDRIWTYRLPSLLGGIAAGWLTVWCALAVAGAEAALLAGLLLLGSVLLTAEATIATTDAVLLACMLGVQGVLLRLYRAARDHDWPKISSRMVMGGWAAFGFGVLIKGPVVFGAVLTILGLVGWDWWEQKRKSKAAAKAAIVAAAIAAAPTDAAKPTPAGAAKAGPAGKPSPDAVAAPAVVTDAAQDVTVAPDADAPQPKPEAVWVWLLSLKPWRGLLLVVLLIMPWLVAITIQSRGAFLEQSLGEDFAAKMAGGQESHGGWPGYYLLLSAISFWPAIAFVLPGIVSGIARRGEPAIRFLLVWAGCWWLAVELIPTKLPHYVIFAYPPLAILAALLVLDPKPILSKLGLFLTAARWIAIAQFVIGAGLLAVAPFVLDAHFDSGGGIWWMNGLGAVGGVVALAALILVLLRKPLWAVVLGLMAMLVFVPALTAVVGPRLDQLWLSERLKTQVAQYSQAGDPPPALAGYEEPSLVFALGKDVVLTDGKGAAEAGAKSGGLALVEESEKGDFLARLAELQADAQLLAGQGGFNYSRGRPVSVNLYRVARQRELN